MKKLLYLFVACCLTTVVSAQKLTEKDLQGTWKLSTFDAGQLKVDIATEKITLSPEVEAQMTPELRQQMEAGMAQAMEMFKESYAYIDGKNFRQTMGPDEQKGTFVLSQKDGKNILTVTAEDGSKEEIVASIVDKKLVLAQTEGSSTVSFVYTKQ